MALEIKDSNFEELLASGKPVVVDFWATWCGPCRMQTPAIEELEQEMGETVKFSKMDIDQNPATAQSFGIMSIPTLMIKKDGEVVDTIVGYHSKDQVKEVLAKYI